ncbi:hypothetical protein PGTUg99_010040 [Puccinia graminis f. sp. tritici]|uniref:Uncharacterized protein n=1 Tax=Puccinia graminis f. sp. tritici TaxID=56615 RepID=A0A5B0SBT6_PUCGR|nr:hypothetical protein PGTUg99_010040 [Puccinia graminis f. sp. tritici]
MLGHPAYANYTSQHLVGSGGYISISVQHHFNMLNTLPPCPINILNTTPSKLNGMQTKMAQGRICTTHMELASHITESDDQSLSLASSPQDPLNSSSEPNEAQNNEDDNRSID